MKDYKQLDVWKISMELAVETYNIVKAYPREELFALSSQTKRAAVSIVSNIAEGIGRQTKRDTIHFLHIARGSVYELETQLTIAFHLKFVEPEHYEKICTLMVKCLQLINGFINYYDKTLLK